MGLPAALRQEQDVCCPFCFTQRLGMSLRTLFRDSFSSSPFDCCTKVGMGGDWEQSKWVDKLFDGCDSRRGFRTARLVLVICGTSIFFVMGGCDGPGHKNLKSKVHMNCTCGKHRANMEEAVFFLPKRRQSDVHERFCVYPSEMALYSRRTGAGLTVSVCVSLATPFLEMVMFLVRLPVVMCCFYQEKHFCDKVRVGVVMR